MSGVSSYAGLTPMPTVNGFRCATCADVSLARDGVDPRNPTRDPVQQAKIDGVRPPESGQSFSETLQDVGGAASTAFGPGAVAAPAAVSSLRLDFYV